MPIPRDAALVAILRGKRVLVPTPDDPIEAGDELVFVCTAEVEDEVGAVILGPDAASGPERAQAPGSGVTVVPSRVTRRTPTP